MVRNKGKGYERCMDALQLLEISGFVSDAEKHKIFKRLLANANRHGYACVKQGFRDYKFVRPKPLKESDDAT